MLRAVSMVLGGLVRCLGNVDHGMIWLVLFGRDGDILLNLLRNGRIMEVLAGGLVVGFMGEMQGKRGDGMGWGEVRVRFRRWNRGRDCGGIRSAKEVVGRREMIEGVGDGIGGIVLFNIKAKSRPGASWRGREGREGFGGKDVGENMCV